MIEYQGFVLRRRNREILAKPPESSLIYFFGSWIDAMKWIDRRTGTIGLPTIVSRKDQWNA